tara:strand:+ start:989 stop:1684 length:696 start_codon:yes stop_codon:yes gene_type:complete
MKDSNIYTLMQKSQYRNGTSNHLEHNENPDYWSILLGDLKDKDQWAGKTALDFACGKGRNVTNMLSLCDWHRVDGVDISVGNIEYCKNSYQGQKSNWYLNNGIDVSCLQDNKYDFVMSTIALQHIPVYEIRKNIISGILNCLKPNGVFSFQMGFGQGLLDPSGLNRPRSAYYDNAYTANGTNSSHDVRVQSEEEIVEDLQNIGFVEIETHIRNSFSDTGHPNWIYVKCRNK